MLGILFRKFIPFSRIVHCTKRCCRLHAGPWVISTLHKLATYVSYTKYMSFQTSFPFRTMIEHHNKNFLLAKQEEIIPQNNMF
jgi:hypothetical protein